MPSRRCCTCHEPCKVSMCESCKELRRFITSLDLAPDLSQIPRDDPWLQQRAMEIESGARQNEDKP